MTVLLVDLGNTALKWATSDDFEQPNTYVHEGNDRVSKSLFDQWLEVKPTRMVGCMVSSERLAFSLTRFFNQHNIDWDWLHPEREFVGNFRLVNRYDRYDQLGSDRWHAAIGAASLYPERPLIVMHMGTATTIDTVLPRHGHLEFCGGRILPGPAMMFRSLVEKTRCRPHGIGQRKDFPTNTDDAISTGILEAHLGAIDRALKAVGQEAQIVFAGGAAPLLAPYIIEEHPDAVRQHNLVLRGLALRALAQ